MVTRERQRSAEVRRDEVFFKKLELLTPDYAAKQGLTVNEPVLTSHSERPALIYQVGQITTATDLAGRDSGIWYDVGQERHVEELRKYVPIGAPITRENDYSGLTSDYKQNSWVAIIEPQGLALTNPRSEYYYNKRRHEAIKIKELLVFCHSCRLGPLQEGLIYSKGNGYLQPLCNIENHADWFKPTTKRMLKEGYRQIELPKVKFEVKPDRLILSEFQGSLESIVSPREKLVISETEPKGVWQLVERARRRFTPESPRLIGPVSIAKACVTFERGSGYPVELYITTHNQRGKEIGSIGGSAASLRKILDFGLSASPGGKTVTKGEHFAAYEFYHFLLKTDTALVIQPAEMYYDFQTREWQAKTPYPVVLHNEELPQIAPFVSSRKFS